MAISVYPPSHSVPHYEHLAEIFLGSFVIWWIIYLICEIIFEKQKSNETYQLLSARQKADYLSRIVANLHAVVASVVAIMALVCHWYVTICFMNKH